MHFICSGNMNINQSLHHLCSSFDREPRVSLETPAVLRELVLRTEMPQTSEPGKVCADEKPPENLSVLESRANGVSGESRRGKEVETISLENSLIHGDVLDEIDSQDASAGGRYKDLFDAFELMLNQSEDVVPESCVNLVEPLDVNDFDDDGMVTSLDDAPNRPLDLVQNIVEKPNIATEVQVDPVDVDRKASENNGFKAEEVLISVESNGVLSSGVLETSNETRQREMELEKPVNSTPVLADSVSWMVEDDDVEEGEITGDVNDCMLVGDDDEPVKRHEESHVSQVMTCNSHLTSHDSTHFLGVGSLQIVDEKEQRQTGKKLGVEVSNIDNQAKQSDQTFNNEEKMDLGISIKKRFVEAKARKKANYRKKRAQMRISLGVKKLKLKPVAPKPKPINYCRHYLKGRCHEGDKCKFSHDITPETKSLPCCYFATQSCMKGDDCPYDHGLSKYPCENFKTKGFCHRGDSCLFSHKVAPQSASETPSENVTTSSTNFAARSLSPQKKSKQTVGEAIAKLSAIQARVSRPVAFLKSLSQSDSSSPKINEHVTPQQIPHLRKPLVVPKGMRFLSLDEASQVDIVKSSLASKQNTSTSDDQTLKQSQHRSFLPLLPPSNISVYESNVAANSSVTRNSGNISCKLLEFLSSFSHGKN